MMKRIMLGGFALLLVCALPALAGKNNGGSMVVHTDDTVNYTFFTPPDYCTEFETVAPPDCEALVSQSNYVDPGGLLGTMVWFLAAFHPDAVPGVTVVVFGLEHNLGPGFISGWNFCGPVNTLEVTDDGWPEAWETAGNSLGLGSPIIDDHLFPFYWFGVYGDTGNFIGTGINPTTGYAGFVSDDNPGFLDRITRFGAVRWFEAGDNVCPVAPIKGACCLPDATCEVYFEAECKNVYNGTYQGDNTVCDADCGACCYWKQDFDGISRRCVVTTAADCADEESFGEIILEVLQGPPGEEELVPVGSDWSYPGAQCTTDPEQADVFWYCQDPRQTPTATEETSWGQLKSLYR